MRMRIHSTALMSLAVMTGPVMAPRALDAQTTFHPSFYGSTELDTRNSQFYLLGTYIGVGGLGWSPYFNVNAYALHYRPIPGNTATSTLKAIVPTLGLAYAARRDGVSFGVGYAMVDDENPGAPGAEGGGSSGVTASFGAYHIGGGRGAMRSQLLSNYNFDSRYFWARGRASIPFKSSAMHPARLGGEVVGQGGGKDGNTSNSWNVGPTFEYGLTPRLRTTFAGGWKSVGGSLFAERENAAYVKLELSYSP